MFLNLPHGSAHRLSRHGITYPWFGFWSHSFAFHFPLEIFFWKITPTLFYIRLLLSCLQLADLAGVERPDEPGSWRGVEACLFGIRAIGRGIPADEVVVVPQVLTMLPRLPGNFHVRYTATLIVGK